MKRLITVRVTPRAKRERLEKTGPDSFQAFVTAPPADGRANAAVVALLCAAFNLAKSNLELIRGEKSRIKIFQIISPEAS